MTTLTAALLALVAAAPETLFVTTDVANVTEAQAKAIASLCSSAYGAAASRRMRSFETGSQDASGERLELAIIGLTKTIRLQEELYGPNGDVQFRASLDALGLDDAPQACERLARALADRVPVETTQRYDTVTRAEAKRRNQKPGVTPNFGVRTGLIGVVGHGVAFAPMMHLDFTTRLDLSQSQWFVDLGGGAMIPGAFDQNNYGGVVLEAGFGRYLLSGDLTPTLAIGLQPRVFFTNGINLAPFVELGLTPSRKSGVRFELAVRATQNAFPITGYDVNRAQFITGSAPPTELSGMVKVLF